MDKRPSFKRASGVLLNVSSLPGEFGIGCFSHDADAFCDMAADMGFSWWQILPVTTIGWGNSPYSGLSTFAGNRLYICPAELYREGLITKEELDGAKYKGQPYTTDYAFAKENIHRVLRLAFARINCEIREKMRKFADRHSYWLDDYALFMAIAKNTGTTRWRDWDDGLKFRDKDALAAARERYAADYEYYVFEQYEFYREWEALKSRVNQRGIRIIGDLPFYVADDSVDVWAHPEMFMLDGGLNATAIAGVPPDAFAKDGQVWGNCLYDLDAMRADGYTWWRRRIKHCVDTYDALRLDHFRAFHSYFSIPACDRHTAVNGHWEKGAGAELLDAVLSDNPDALFIAEDLGDIDDECRAFIDGTGFPTMRVFQFGFDGTPSVHMPYRYDRRSVAYTGTHDNNTTLGWLYELNDGARDFALKYCGFEGAGWGAGGPANRSVKAIIKTVIASSAVLAILPVQDMLGYGADTRMNVPGVAEGNWTYRLPYELMTTVDRNFYLDINNTYGRNTGGGAE